MKYDSKCDEVDVFMRDDGEVANAICSQLMAGALVWDVAVPLSYLFVPVRTSSLFLPGCLRIREFFTTRRVGIV
jgi:hypothetical protein